MVAVLWLWQRESELQKELRVVAKKGKRRMTVGSFGKFNVKIEISRGIKEHVPLLCSFALAERHHHIITACSPITTLGASQSRS